MAHKLGAASAVDVSFSTGFDSYFISVNGKTWLESGMTGFRNEGKWATLKLSKTMNQTGVDPFGSYNSVVLIYEEVSTGWYGEKAPKLHLKLLEAAALAVVVERSIALWSVRLHFIRHLAAGGVAFLIFDGIDLLLRRKEGKVETLVGGVEMMVYIWQQTFRTSLGN